MKINLIGADCKRYAKSFKSTRTDRNAVSTLVEGKKPINENQKINILNSINNLASNPNKDNIKFLLSTAENLAYGQKGEYSDFKYELDKDGITEGDRENIDWSKTLQENILAAIKKSDDKEELYDEFFDAFTNNFKLTPLQSDILNLRNDITEKIISEDITTDEEKLAQSGRIRKNLDYFVASSEISDSEKKECLEKFSYLLSDKYEINEQLQDKKLQVVDEMLNDMVIKTPADNVLTIKSVDQRYSGICAAISICRKAIAYEDKSRYMDIVMNELSNSKTMEVYDITDLESQNKVELEKADIDYNSAINKGYRIIDASAHIWMQNAHASGNGTIQTEKYTAFDDNAYGIYDDSSWFEGLDNEISPYKELLKAVIKEKELVERLGQRKKTNHDYTKNLNSVKNKLNEDFSTQTALLRKTINNVFKNENKSEITAKSILAFYNGTKENGERNIAQQQSRQIKENIIRNYIEESNPEMSAEEKTALKQNAGKILLTTEEINKINGQIKRLSTKNTPAAKYRHNKLLYQTAAAHRLAMEADVNLHDGVIRYQSELNLPPQDKAAVNYLKSVGKGFTSEQIRKTFAGENGEVPSKEELEAQLSVDIIKLESIIPNEINDIMQKILGYTVKEEVLMILNMLEKNINENDPETINRTAALMGCTNDKKSTLKEVENCKKKLENEGTNNSDLQDVIRKIGYESEINFANFIIGSFFETLKNGISKEAYKELQKRLNVKDLNYGMREISNRYEQLVNEYNNIYEKWNIPDSRKNILKAMEKNKFVLSKRELEILKNRFDTIQKGIVANEKNINDVNLREKENTKLYKFTEEENNILKKIDDGYATIRKYNTIKYKDLNEFLKEDLEEQYAKIGMLNGQFWVREEGSSGLSSVEQLRILEQMTGKPYHIEYDVKNAAKQIKEGKGSGIIATSVDDKDYAFHAQYVPSVTEETMINPATGKIEKKDILWTDNSWGKSEREFFWDGKDGFKHTDYGRKYGWKNGFITDDTYKIGLPVDEISTAVGHSRDYDEDFGLFSDIILQGRPANQQLKLQKLLKYIIESETVKNNLDALAEALNNGSKINTENLDKLDEIASAKADKLEKEAMALKSADELDKLDDNNELKLTLNKLATYMATDNPVLREYILNITDNDQLNKMQEGILGEHTNVFLYILGKSQDNIDSIEGAVEDKLPSLVEEIKNNTNIEITEEEQTNILEEIFNNQDELGKLSGSLSDLEEYLLNKTANVISEKFENKEIRNTLISEIQKKISEYTDTELRVKDLNSKALTLSPLQDNFINTIDKYFNPKDDDELLRYIQGLQECSMKDITKFLNVLTDEDVNLNYKAPYEYVKQLKAENQEVSKAFSDIVVSNEISKYLPDSYGDNETPEELYRDLYIKLTDMDVQKFIKKFKAEAFEKYKSRQAFPEPVVLDEASIEENIDNFLTQMFEFSKNVNDASYSYDIITTTDKIYKEYNDYPFFQNILNSKNVNKSENAKDLELFVKDLEDLYNLTQNGDEWEDIPNITASLIKDITSENKELNGENTLNKLNCIYDKLEKFGVNATSLEEIEKTKKEGLKTIKNYTRVYVNSSINPKYRDEAIGKFNNIIKGYSKNEDREELANKINELRDFIIDNHITKCPTLLLKDFVEQAQNPNRDEATYEVLKQYLIATLEVAQQTKIQYQLVQNQHEGISSKIKEMLPALKITDTTDAGREFTNEDTINYIIEMLNNKNDGNKILNLFLNQSGLEKDTVKAIVNTFNLKTATERFEEQAELVSTYASDVITLKNVLQEFLSKSNFQYASFQDVLDNLIKYVERRTRKLENSSAIDGIIMGKSIKEFINSNNKDALNDLSKFMVKKVRNSEDSDVINDFLNKIKETHITDEQAVIKKEMYKSVTEIIIDGIFESISENINTQIEYLNAIPTMLQDRYDLLQSINVKPDEETEEMLSSFDKKYEETINYMNELWDKITPVIDKISE